MLLPPSLGCDIGFPGGEQLIRVPSPIAEGGPGVTDGWGQQANRLKGREESPASGQQGAADLHPQEVCQSQIGTDG